MKTNNSITKWAAILGAGFLSFISWSAQADSLVATQSTTSCVWTQTGSYGGSGGAQINYNVTCPNDSFQASKIITGNNCQLQLSSPYYAIGVSGNACSSYSIYKVSSQTSSSAASSTGNACQTSGKAGKYVTTGYSSGVVTAAQQASQYCLPCGTYTQTVANGGYAFYCNLQ